MLKETSSWCFYRRATCSPSAPIFFISAIHTYKLYRTIGLSRAPDNLSAVSVTRSRPPACQPCIQFHTNALLPCPTHLTFSLTPPHPIRLILRTYLLAPLCKFTQRCCPHKIPRTARPSVHPPLVLEAVDSIAEKPIAGLGIHNS